MTAASTKSQVISWRERSNSIALTFLIIFFECCPLIYSKKITWSPTSTSRIIRCARCLQGMVKPFMKGLFIIVNKAFQAPGDNRKNQISEPKIQHFEKNDKDRLHGNLTSCDPDLIFGNKRQLTLETNFRVVNFNRFIFFWSFIFLFRKSCFSRRQSFLFAINCENCNWRLKCLNNWIF